MSENGNCERCRHHVLSQYLLIESYLTDPNFQVCYGSSVSSIACINACVPQGGIPSSIIYNIYPSDKPTTPCTLIEEYADDKAIIISTNVNPLLAYRKAQNHLNLMEKWYTNWRFKVNQDKSYPTTFTLKTAPWPNVTLYGVQIPSSKQVNTYRTKPDERGAIAPEPRPRRGPVAQPGPPGLITLNSLIRFLSGQFEDFISK